MDRDKSEAERVTKAGSESIMDRDESNNLIDEDRSVEEIFQLH